MPCRNGCEDWFHLKNQDGCQSCVSRWMAEARQKRQAREAQKASEKENADADFWNPGRRGRSEGLNVLERSKRGFPYTKDLPR